MKIQTERLVLCRMTADELDLDTIRKHVEWLNDPQAMRFSEQRHLTHTCETQTQYIKDHHKAGHALFNIVVRGSRWTQPTTIGSLTAYFDVPNTRVDMGIMIGPPFCGQGYGSEAWYGLFDELEASKIEAGVMEGNSAMIRICEQRMRFEGSRKSHFLGPDGQRYDLLQFGYP